MKIFIYFLFFFTTITLSQNTAHTVNRSLEDSIYKKITEGVLIAINSYKFNEGIQLTTKYTELAKSIKNDSLIGKGYYALAIINAELGNVTTAIKLLKKSEKILLETKNYRPLGYTYSNMANLYYELKKDTLSSLFYAKKAITFFNKGNNNRGIEIVYYNLGHLFEEINRLNKAITSLNDAIYYAKEKENNYILSYAYQTLSKVYFKKDDFYNSMKYANLALSIAEKNKFQDILIKLYKLKYLVHKRNNQPHKTILFLEKLTALSETTFEKEIGVKEREAAAIFEIKKKQQLLDKINLENKRTSSKIKKAKYFNFFIGFSIIALFGLTLLLYKNSVLKKKQNKLLLSKNNELKKLQIETELNFLKHQIQPHFFFNTLNNIYSLLIINSKKADNVINKLSGLMKYALYDSNNYKTPILTEIKNIKNYIAIENIRYNRETFSNIKIDDKLENIHVPPLIYITFIENCFKHGNISDRCFYTAISFKNHNATHLIFTISNSFNYATQKEKKQSGIGLKNNKRRLQLIYKDNFSLKTVIKNNIYTTTLILPI